jgi:hypothetical protein
MIHLYLDMLLLTLLGLDYGNHCLLTNLILVRLIVVSMIKHYKVDKELNILPAFYILMIQRSKENSLGLNKNIYLFQQQFKILFVGTNLMLN